MKYNRAMDLLAMSLGATKAGMPVKAAKFMQEAADHQDADEAIKTICSMNTKPKNSALAVFGEEDDLMEDADDLKLESSADEDGEGEDEDGENVEATILAAVATAMSKVRAKSDRRQRANPAPDRDKDQQPGQDEREKPKVTKASTEAAKRFARTLANLSK